MYIFAFCIKNFLNFNKFGLRLCKVKYFHNLAKYFHKIDVKSGKHYRKIGIRSGILYIWAILKLILFVSFLILFMLFFVFGLSRHADHILSINVQLFEKVFEIFFIWKIVEFLTNPYTRSAVDIIKRRSKFLSLKNFICGNDGVELFLCQVESNFIQRIRLFFCMVHKCSMPSGGKPDDHLVTITNPVSHINNIVRHVDIQFLKHLLNFFQPLLARLTSIFSCSWYFVDWEA